MYQLESIIDRVIDDTRVPPCKFGCDLQAYMEEQSKVLPFLNVPVILRKCARNIVLEGRSRRDLFSAGGSKRTDELIEDFEKGGYIPSLRREDSRDVADLLREFLKLLKYPLLSNGTDDDDLQSKFEADMELSGYDRLDAIEAHIKLLPRIHKHTLRELFFLFSRVTKKRKLNGIYSDDIADVFAEKDILSNTMSSNTKFRIFRYFIDEYRHLFKKIDPLEEDLLFLTPSEITIFYEDGKYKRIPTNPSDNIGSIKEKGEVTDEIYDVQDRSYKLLGNDDRIPGEAVFAIPRLRQEDSSNSREERRRSPSPARGRPAEVPVPKPVVRNDSSEELSGSPTRAEKEAMLSLPDPIVVPPPTSAPPGPASPIVVPARASVAVEGPIKHLIYAFEDIPENPITVRHWDCSQALEAEMELEGGEYVTIHIKITQRGAEKNYKFPATTIHTLHDSSRFFVLKDRSQGILLGIGFSTRTDAGIFKIELSDTLRKQSATHPFGLRGYN
eukprot:TRINITY_DN7017_c0_g1_i1.p1 TRINITY_DN7017_c0_g1~~TRINITY_DN7017_c0_g1_i1.p1  ORF type:complete len:500 (-),score=133.11 TRINITY_DN7017_c0_g1_i1:43-1542(-)